VAYGHQTFEKSEIRIQDEHPGSYFRELRHHNSGLKYLNSLMLIWNEKILYLGSVNSLMRIRDGKILDPGWKNYYPGSGIFFT
jgi:hypothetical protein